MLDLGKVPMGSGLNCNTGEMRKRVWRFGEKGHRPRGDVSIMMAPRGSRMDSWYEVTRKDWAITDVFEAIWSANGGPKDAALFGKRNRDKTKTFYFNPPAARLAVDLLHESGAMPCSPLNLKQLHFLRGPVLLVGDQSVIERND